MLSQTVKEFWQEAQLSQRDPRDVLYQLKCCPTVVRMTHTDHDVSAWGALSATGKLYSATCIVLYTHRYSRLNFSTVSMRCRACHKQTSIQPSLLSVVACLFYSRWPMAGFFRVTLCMLRQNTILRQLPGTRRCAGCLLCLQTQ